MKSLFIIAASLAMTAAVTFGETYDNITVSGTATINELDVSGLFDLQGNTEYFGSVQGDPSHPGATFTYTDGSNGANAEFNSILTQPEAGWNWQRQGASVSAM